MKEIWKDIEGYGGMYQVSNHARIRSFKRHNEDGTPVILKPWQKRKGYFCIGLSKNSKSRRFRRSRLVAKAFVPNPENKPQVNHIDGDKTNDLPYNLEWVTESENRQHAWDEGLHKMTDEIKKKIGDANRGEKCASSKLTEKDVIEIRYRYKNTEVYQRELADDYGVSQSAIGFIVNNKRWTHI